MKAIRLCVLNAGVLAVAAAAVAPIAAQDAVMPWVSEGSISVGGIATDINAVDASKAGQYRDLSDGILSAILFRGRRPDAFWFDFYGENFGRDDMYVNLRGGQYDSFRYRLRTDWLTQNRAFHARTPFLGSGTGDLRSTFPQANPGTWESLTIGYDRRDTGGYFEWQRNSPWYFRVDANVVEREGTKIGSAANGTSPGQGFTDLAIPIDYRTTTAGAELGYSTPKYHFATSYSVSNFDSGFKTVTWSNPLWANGIDTTHLAPDNDYQRFAANATIRQLPMRSTFAARFTWDRLESDTTLATSALNGTGAGAFGLTNPNVRDYHGRVQNTTFSLALTSAPARAVDTRVFYYYNKRDNDSTHVEYRPVTGLACGTEVVGGATRPGPCENELYSYEKWNLGADAFWRFARGHRLGGGVEYQHADQRRPDYDEVENTRLFLEYRNTTLDTLGLRVKYTHLDRDSNFLLSHHGADANDPLFLERFIGRFDGSSLKRNELKLTLDWNPMPLLDIGFEAIWRDNGYKDLTLGRTDDRRQEYYVSAAYGDPAKWRVLVFADYEKIRYDSFHRNVNAGACPTTSGGVTAVNCFDPGTPPNAIAYNWSAVNRDTNWSLGAGLDWPVRPNLLLKASYLYYRTDGKADIATQNNFGNPLPITAYDDTRTQSFNLKAIYEINRNWQATAGYAYEKYEYSDDQYNGYQYTVPFPAVVNNTSQSYLNGFNAFRPYKANIFYLVGTYRF